MQSVIRNKRHRQYKLDKNGKCTGDFAPNMELAILRNDPIIQDWLAQYPEGTKRNYLTNVNIFLNRTGKRPKDLVPMDALDIKRALKAVMGALVNEGNPYAAVGAMHAVRSFATFYEKTIKLAYGEKVRVGRMKNHIAPRPHEVYAIAEAASAISNPVNPRNKAMVMLDWVTALRENALRSLKCGALDGFSEDDCPIPLKVGNKFQTNTPRIFCIDQKLSGYGVDYYYTFIAKEGFLAVQEWLEYRKAKIGSFDKNDTVFCQVHQSRSGRVGDVIHPHTAWEMFKNALPKVGIDRNSMTFHKLRSSFKSVMIRADCDEEVREVLMGHAPPGSQKNYFDYHDVEMARKEYKKADWSRAGTHRLDKMEQQYMDLQQKYNTLLGQQASNVSFQETFQKFMERYMPKEQAQ